MRARSRSIGILILLIVLAAPTALGQTTQYGSTSGDPRFAEDAAACNERADNASSTACIVQYAHIFDLLNEAPLNVYRPPDDAEDISSGFTTTPGWEPLWDLNSMTLRPVAGTLEYPGPEPRPAVHPPYGLATDLVLDPTLPIFAYWYMSADLDEFSPLGIDQTPDGEDPNIGALPCLTVRVTIETGRFPGDGPVVSEGSATKTVITGISQDAPDVELPACPGAGEAPIQIDEVIEFAIELPPVQDTLSAADGYLATVEWWNHAPGHPDQEDKVYLQSWNVHTGPDHAPRLVLPVVEPMAPPIVDAEFLDGTVTISGQFQTPFGEADIDRSSIRFGVYDASGDEVTVRHASEPMLRYGHSSMVDFAPTTALIQWEAHKESLPTGTYTLRMSAQNWQWTSEVHGEVTVFLESQTAESPMPVPSMFLLALLAILGLARGRRSSASQAIDHHNP